MAAEWANGKKDANDLLKKYFGSSEAVDFTDLWSKSDIDLLWPVDPKSYVGSKYSSDDERSESEPIVTPECGVSENGDDLDDVPIGMDIEDF